MQQACSVSRSRGLLDPGRFIEHKNKLAKDYRLQSHPPLPDVPAVGVEVALKVAEELAVAHTDYVLRGADFHTLNKASWAVYYQVPVALEHIEKAERQPTP